jgi:predicted transcriptional regulator
MRVSAGRTLDDRYMEFINDLKSLGELQNVISLIVQRSSTDLSNVDVPSNDTDLDLRNLEASTAMRELWENGSIELLKAKRFRKGTLKRAFKLNINLEKISRHFEQERISKSIQSHLNPIL